MPTNKGKNTKENKSDFIETDEKPEEGERFGSYEEKKSKEFTPNHSKGSDFTNKNKSKDRTGENRQKGKGFINKTPGTKLKDKLSKLTNTSDVQASLIYDWRDVNDFFAQFLDSAKLEQLSKAGQLDSGIEVTIQSLLRLKRSGQYAFIGKKVKELKKLFSRDDVKTGVFPAQFFSQMKRRNLNINVEDIEFFVDTIGSAPVVAKCMSYANYGGFNPTWLPGTHDFGGYPIQLNYKEQLSSLNLLTMETQGTNYLFHDMYVNERDYCLETEKDDVVLANLRRMYDIVIAEAIALFNLYIVFFQTLNYLRGINSNWDTCVNMLQGPVHDASTFNGSFTALLSKLAAFFVDFNIYKMTHGKFTSVTTISDGMRDPLEITAVRFFSRTINGEEVILNYTNNHEEATIDRPFIPSIWRRNEEGDDTLIFGHEDYAALLNSIYNAQDMLLDFNPARRNWTSRDWTQWRNNFVQSLNIVILNLTNFKDSMLDFEMVLEKASSMGVQTPYVYGIKETVEKILQETAPKLGVDSTIKLFTNINNAATAPLANGSLVTYNLIPDIAFGTFVTTSDIQYFKGEVGLYHPFVIMGNVIDFHFETEDKQGSMTLNNDDNEWVLNYSQTINGATNACVFNHRSPVLSPFLHYTNGFQFLVEGLAVRGFLSDPSNLGITSTEVKTNLQEVLNLFPTSAFRA